MNTTVTEQNFVRAETDHYFGTVVGRGAMGRFDHRRDFAPIELKDVRPNRDTLYSSGIFDLDAGPVTITLPDPGARYMSLQVIDQDHYSLASFYGPGRWTFDRRDFDTRYICGLIRTLADPADPDDMLAAHALQDKVQIEQANGPGSWSEPNWDLTSLKKVRDALKVLGEALPDMNRAAGRKGEVDPTRHLIVTSSGWGLQPERDATYLYVVAPDNSGAAHYVLKVPRDVPVDGFWSVSVYDADGYYRKNELNAYTINNITAEEDSDGGVSIHFGGCEAGAKNCLPVFEGWNYLVRLYRPREEVLSGGWKFPQPAASG